MRSDVSINLCILEVFHAIIGWTMPMLRSVMTAKACLQLGGGNIIVEYVDKSSVPAVHPISSKARVSVMTEWSAYVTYA
jgi:hypothetical protein